MSARIELEIDDLDTGERLDRWLSDQLPDVSRARIQKLIEQGHVHLNQQQCVSKKQRLQGGDRIQLEIPDAVPLDLLAEPMPLEVLYEDDHLLIINKPSGMVVHPAPGHATGTLVNALLAHCDRLAGIGGVQRPGIVHRLDKDTSGAIAVAKTDVACVHLQEQFRTKTARRIYQAVVHGIPAQSSGTIDQPIGRHLSDRKKMAVVPEEKGGRSAVTHWTLRERLGNYSLLDFQLETGRTHQIRVHTTFFGHPVVGDPLYSSNRSIGINLAGQALHAYQLRLTHPVTGQIIQAIAPCPAEFNKLLTVLRNRIST